MIEKAKLGQVKIFITTQKLLPENWLPKQWKGLDVLGLASGGGQQMPVIAAAGANVTSFDFSEEQLKRDEEVCEKEGLQIKTQKGLMEDLGIFHNETFDFVINPVSTCYTSNVKRVWKEVYRILRFGGRLITGFNNPVAYSLDFMAYRKNKKMKLIHSIPYSDIKSLSEEDIKTRSKTGEDSLEFGHSLSDLIGGQIEAGFKITGFYELLGRGF